MKTIRNLLLAIVVSFPMVRDGNTIYDMTQFCGAKQIHKYVVLLPSGQQDQVQLTFDEPLEANHFIDMYANWLVQGRK